MNQILLFEEDFLDDRKVVLNDHRATHIKEILKPKIGQKIKVGLLNKGNGAAEILSFEEKKITLQVENLSKKPPESVFTNLTLILALPRPQTLKKVLETAATFGVSRIFLVGAARVEKSFFQSSLFKSDAYKEYLYLGLQQGGYTIPPEVIVFQKQNYWDEINNIPKRYIAHPESIQKFSSDSQKNQPMVLAIGPEGGWLDQEISQFESNGFTKITLGNTIHRVENAVCASLAQLELLKDTQ